MKSRDLRHWEYAGPFMTREMPDVERSSDSKINEDMSCPNFFKIGNKYMLLCISHLKGCRYYLGELKLHASPDNTRGIDLVVDPSARTIQLGATTAPFDLRPQEDLQIRIFIDRRIVEVFANDRQAIFKQHAYEPDETGVCLFSEGGNMDVEEIKAWKMAASTLW